MGSEVDRLEALGVRTTIVVPYDGCLHPDPEGPAPAPAQKTPTQSLEAH